MRSDVQGYTVNKIKVLWEIRTHTLGEFECTTKIIN